MGILVGLLEGIGYGHQTNRTYGTQFEMVFRGIYVQ